MGVLSYFSNLAVLCCVFQVVSRKDFPPPPAAHSRTSKHPSASPHPPQEAKLPKVEPNFNMYGYPAYQPVGLLATADKMGKEMPNPPPLHKESTSSVIVKNETKPPSSKLQYQAYPPRAPTPQNLASKRHLPSPPDSRQVLYPTGLPFATAGKGSAVAYPYSTAPPNIYGPPTTNVKPKVSSPAPPHFYGKPTAVLGPPPPTQHARDVPSPLPFTSKAGAYIPGPPPPPAHTSSRHAPMEHARVMDHVRMYPQGPPAPPSPSPGATPTARASPHQIIPPRATVCQTQPLDLGLSSRDSNSPKRSAPSPDTIRKKRFIDPTVQTTSPPAQLSRVSEPSPLIASAATTITTVENTAVSGSVIRPPQPVVVNTPVTEPSPSKPPSPVPKQTPTYTGHKHLKKAWLQRHSGEDVTEQRCVTPVTPSPSPAPSSPIANRETTTASPPQPVTPKGKLGAAKSAIAAVRKATASVVLPLNGHADSPAADADSSSSADEAPAQRKTPVKRKPKVKRKKGAKKTVQDNKKVKVPSESASESDKESGTEKDSEDSVSSTMSRNKTGIKETPSGNTSNNTSTNAGNSNNSNNGGKKRGRRPKSKNDDNNRPVKKQKGDKERDNSPTPPSRDPIRKPPISTLKKTGETFLQDGYCFEIAPKLAKCRECRLTQNQRSKTAFSNIFCRFYFFRRLRYTKNGQLAIAGFSDPYTDASEVRNTDFYCSKALG